MLKIFNSKSRKKEKFIPLSNKTVKMYVCGITPYDTTHLGHAFTYVFFDVLRRYLEYKGYKVVYTQNITDIDDDILKRAKKEKKNWKELGEFWTKKYLGDMEALNVLPVTHYVKATNSITLMIRIIRVLINKKYAYQKSGNVYFDVKKFKKYGKLSHYTKRQMIYLSKERGANPDDPFKKDPLDFVLWQKSASDEPYWENPWGRGRPGWHIECSAMINEYLGERIDIHGGGRDLIFPHHESEIAQSEIYTNKEPFVKYWMHTGMVLYEGEKMSKSLGNLVMVADLLKNHTANEVRYVLLSHYYREPWEFEKSELHIAKKALKLIEQALSHSDVIPAKVGIHTTYFDQFNKVMDNDLQTQEALKLAERLTKRILNAAQKSDVSELQKSLTKILSILGFF